MVSSPWAPRELASTARTASPWVAELLSRGWLVWLGLLSYPAGFTPLSARLRR